MKFWFDTEFIEDGKTIDLMSIGIVSEDGREFYVENRDCDLRPASKWVRENVFPHLVNLKHFDYGKPYIASSRSSMDFDQIGPAVLEFIGNDNPEIWAYYADYDWVAMCQLFGTMMDLPKGWPMYCRDLKQLAGDTPLPEQGKGEHHALADARWTRDAWQYVTSL